MPSIAAPLQYTETNHLSFVHVCECQAVKLCEAKCLEWSPCHLMQCCVYALLVVYCRLLPIQYTETNHLSLSNPYEGCEAVRSQVPGVEPVPEL